MTLTLSKKERLKSSKIIDRIFKERCSVSKYPLRLLWVKTPDADVDTAAFFVSKKHFRHAVDRNRIKRLMREVYRTHRGDYTAGSDTRHAFVIMWSNNEMPTHALMTTLMDALFDKWKEKTPVCS